MRNMEKRIFLKCQVCGNDQFSFFDKETEDLLSAADDIKVKCSDCGFITTKGQIIDDNRYIISENVADFKKEVLDKLKSDLKRKLR